MNMRAGDPFPNAPAAFSLAAAATFVSFLVPMLTGSSIVGSALLAVLGLGGLGFLTARYVPEPNALRLGLMHFPQRALGAVALLAPAVFVISEFDNWIRLAFAAKSIEGLGAPTFPALEGALFAVLLQPVVNEFFFRGVLLQGSIASLGRWGAILYVAALEVVLYPTVLILLALLASEDAPLAALVSGAVRTLSLGVLCGALRLATGSLFPGIALTGLTAAIGIGFAAIPDRAPIPGFNAPGDATPLSVLVPAALSVAAGLWLLARQLEREPALPPIPPPQVEDDEEPGSLF